MRVKLARYVTHVLGTDDSTFDPVQNVVVCFLPQSLDYLSIVQTHDWVSDKDSVPRKLVHFILVFGASCAVPCVTDPYLAQATDKL